MHFPPTDRVRQEIHTSSYNSPLQHQHPHHQYDAHKHKTTFECRKNNLIKLSDKPQTWSINHHRITTTEKERETALQKLDFFIKISISFDLTLNIDWSLCPRRVQHAAHSSLFYVATSQSVLQTFLKLSVCFRKDSVTSYSLCNSRTDSQSENYANISVHLPETTGERESFRC